MRSAKAWLRQLGDWSHWPFGLFYLPLLPVWLWLCWRGRSFWFFSSSNPAIPFGGFEGESKREVYAQLPESSYPRTVYVNAGDDPLTILHRVSLYGIVYPLIVKPDVGMEGIGVRRISDVDALLQYHAHMPAAYLIQEWAIWPIEVSIFYYRYPGNATGHISGFFHKVFPVLTGNGTLTIGWLIGREGFSRSFFRHLHRTYASTWNTVLQPGEFLDLSIVGNRYYGVRFEDLSQRINPLLVSAFDQLSHFGGGLFYGRYDIKCRSIEEMANAQHFTILEFNGAGAIPNHVYTGRYTLVQAYREIARHWNRLYRISRLNNDRGAVQMSFSEGLRLLVRAKKHFRVLRRYQKEGWI
ncbi:MAG: hypothetical protein H0X41_03010 [Chitinophagaceae bacterium]|nr:hypothetical protein [Chitinophagaceae bacterium]